MVSIMGEKKIVGIGDRLHARPLMFDQPNISGIDFHPDTLL